jgi:hypothetical protein
MLNFFCKLIFIPLQEIGCGFAGGGELHDVRLCLFCSYWHVTRKVLVWPQDILLQLVKNSNAMW